MAPRVAPHLSFLAKLVARDSNLGRAHLFTLNYDTLFEQALELLGIQYFDGFTGRADARLDPSVYGLDIYYPGEQVFGRFGSLKSTVSSTAALPAPTALATSCASCSFLLAISIRPAHERKLLNFVFCFQEVTPVQPALYTFFIITNARRQQ